MEWRGLWAPSEGRNLPDGCAVWTQRFPPWTFQEHWSPAESPSSSLTTLEWQNKTGALGLEEGWDGPRVGGCGPLSSRGVTSSAGVSQWAADFILGGRHAGYKQHVGHRAQTVIRSQTTLFFGTSGANRRRSGNAAADIHWAPALPPSRLFISTHPNRHSESCLEEAPQGHKETLSSLV